MAADRRSLANDNADMQRQLDASRAELLQLKSKCVASGLQGCTA